MKLCKPSPPALGCQELESRTFLWTLSKAIALEASGYRLGIKRSERKDSARSPGEDAESVEYRDSNWQLPRLPPGC